MGEFFKPWRRKLGCVTLVIACVFAAGWVRSLRSVDNTAFTIGGGSLVQLISRNSTVAVRRIMSRLPVKSLTVDRVLLMGFQAPQGNSTGNLAINVDAKTRAAEGSPYRWMMNVYHFEIGGVDDLNFPLQVFIISIPYWSLVIPLTLLSAWLLLSKPRPPNQEKLPEHVQDERGAAS